MTASPILAVAQDPGGAEALVPVLSALIADEGSHVCIIGQAHAVDVFAAEDLPFVRFDDLGKGGRDAQEIADRILLDNPPRLVLTATSFGVSPERYFIRAAKHLGVPCLTVLDSWTNYTRRFLKEGETELVPAVLPDVCTVMDEFAATEMERAGFPRSVLRVVGQPALDRFTAVARATPQAARTGLCHDLGIPETDPIIVYFSQPVLALYGRADSATFRGYTEFDVLSVLVEAISLCGTRATLVVKTHPKERLGKYDDLLDQTLIRSQLVHQFDSDRIVLGADVAVGMTSIALMKAFLIGRRVISVQPNLIGEDECVLGRAGYIKPVTDGRLLVPALGAALERDGRDVHLSMLPNTLTDGLAVQRIMSVIRELVDHQPRERTLKDQAQQA